MTDNETAGTEDELEHVRLEKNINR